MYPATQPDEADLEHAIPPFQERMEELYPYGLLPGDAAGTVPTHANTVSPTMIDDTAMNAPLTTLKRVTEPQTEILPPAQAIGQNDSVFREWKNGVTRPLPAENIPDLIAQAFTAMPSQPAVDFYGVEISRRELAERSDRLAAWLVRHGAGPASLVAVYMDRSVEMLIAVLGAMKAGAAYVPLDPAFPAARIEQILDETQVPVMITLARHLDTLPRSNAEVIALDAEALERESLSADILPAVSRDMRAYVIFTSGSTGKPKGVEVTHGSVVNLLADLAVQLDMKSTDRWLAVTTLSFDIAVLELLLPLVSGGTVVLADHNDVSDSARLLEQLHASGATVLQATPVTWRMLLEHGFQPGNGFKMLCGGEAWTPAVADQLLGNGQYDARLWNLYGPTETTVWSSVTELKPGAERMTIGPPIANTRFYILDSNLRPVTPGVAGELFIAGRGVARGYFNRAQLTSEKFLRDPFFPEGRMYRTGDGVRELADGSIEFLGRLDHQVKLRGHRIELGEIESALRALPDLREAAVVLRVGADAEPILAAYYTGAENRSAEQLKQFLSKSLPVYMVPAILRRLENFPLTPNGKLDRRALPGVLPSDTSGTPFPLTGAEDESYDPKAGSGDSPVLSAPQRLQPREQEHRLNGPIPPDLNEPPSAVTGSQSEREMLRIWQHLFRVHEIDGTSNFFDLGGHSLLLARLQAAIKKKFDVQLTAADVFRQPTVSQLAAWVDQARAGSAGSPIGTNPRIVPIQPLGSERPLFAISQSMIFRTLAKELGMDQPVYALQMLDEDVTPARANATVEELAAFYLQLIREVQPSGPYRLVGWCVSGWIAYEVARQLESRDEEVELLMVMDAWAPAHWGQQHRLRRLSMQTVYRIQGLRWTIHKLRQITASERRAYIRRRIHGMAAAAARDLSALLHNMSVPIRVRLTEEMRPSEQLEYIACMGYAPGPLRAPLVVFRSEEQPTGPLLALDMGWGSLLGRRITAEPLPGDHQEIFDLPGARIMAHRAQEVLGRRVIG